MKESIPLTWRRIRERYLLEATFCRNCEGYFFPPRNICPKCRRKEKTERVRLSGKGSVISHTVIRVAPEGLEGHVPYVMAIVRMDEGVNVLGQVVDTGKVEIGDRVEVVFRKIQQDDPEGVIHYGFKFRKVEEGKKG